MSGIRNAYSKSLNDGVAEYEIEFEGKAMDLAMGFPEPNGWNIKVTGITGNRIIRGGTVKENTIENHVNHCFPLLASWLPG